MSYSILYQLQSCQLFNNKKTPLSQRDTGLCFKTMFPPYFKDGLEKINYVVPVLPPWTYWKRYALCQDCQGKNKRGKGQGSNDKKIWIPPIRPVLADAGIRGRLIKSGMTKGRDDSVVTWFPPSREWQRECGNDEGCTGI